MDLTPAQEATLRHLYRQGDDTPSNIAEAEDYHRVSISRALSELACRTHGGEGARRPQIDASRSAGGERPSQRVTCRLTSNSYVTNRNIPGGVALEVYEYDGHGIARNRLVECPLCGYSFSENEPRWKHFLNDHDPEDAGLSPLGEIPDGAGEPLFVPIDELPDPIRDELRPAATAPEAETST